MWSHSYYSFTGFTHREQHQSGPRFLTTTWSVIASLEFFCRDSVRQRRRKRILDFCACFGPGKGCGARHRCGGGEPLQGGGCWAWLASEALWWLQFSLLIVMASGQRGAREPDLWGCMWWAWGAGSRWGRKPLFGAAGSLTVSVAHCRGWEQGRRARTFHTAILFVVRACSPSASKVSLEP